MKHDADVIVIGGGVAGLTAARAIAGAGRRTILLEARDRLGGRIHTIETGQGVPIELGAEFVHGRPEPLWGMLRAMRLPVYDVLDERWQFHRGRVRRIEDMDKALEPVMGRLANPRLKDESFAEFVARHAAGVPAASVELAWSFVEGFNAADAHRIGTHGLRAAESEGDSPDLLYRPLRGYGELVQRLAAGLGPEVEVRLGAVVREVRWGGGGVELRVQSAGATSELRARCAVVTLPLGVLKMSPGRGGVRFTPELPAAKRRAIARLEMGSVVKTILRFREPFWETQKLPALERGIDPCRMTLVQGYGPAVPTWWTTLPIRSAVLTGWAGGPAAQELSSIARLRGAEAVLTRAIDSLATILGLPAGELRGRLDAWHMADWQSDPFSRGAYSYVPVGGLRLPQQLAKPLRRTLFFAGEATASGGVGGTVESAIESGQRVSREVLRAV